MKLNDRQIYLQGNCYYRTCQNHRNNCIGQWDMERKKLIDRSLSLLTSREITQQSRCFILDSTRLIKIIIEHNIIIKVPMQI